MSNNINYFQEYLIKSNLHNKYTILEKYINCRFKIKIKHNSGKNGFIKQKLNDDIKHKYCLNNNIQLLYILYNQINNINNILDKKL